MSSYYFFDFCLFFYGFLFIFLRVCLVSICFELCVCVLTYLVDLCHYFIMKSTYNNTRAILYGSILLRPFRNSKFQSILLHLTAIFHTLCENFDWKWDINSIQSIWPWVTFSRLYVLYFLFVWLCFSLFLCQVLGIINWMYFYNCTSTVESSPLSIPILFWNAINAPNSKRWLTSKFKNLLFWRMKLN